MKSLFQQIKRVILYSIHIGKSRNFDDAALLNATGENLQVFIFYFFYFVIVTGENELVIFLYLYRYWMRVEISCPYLYPAGFVIL